MDDGERVQYETYLRERSFLAGASVDTRRLLDRSLLALSSGAIALSLVFLDRIQASPASSAWLIPCFWGLFAACIVIVLCSQWTSIRAFRRALEIYEDDLQSGESCDQVSGFVKATTFLNGFAMLLFVLGIISFLVFAFVNRSSINGG